MGALRMYTYYLQSSELRGWSGLKTLNWLALTRSSIRGKFKSQEKSHLGLGKTLTCTSDLLLTSRVVAGGVGWGWVGCDNVLGARHRDYTLTVWNLSCTCVPTRYQIFFWIWLGGGVGWRSLRPPHPRDVETDDVKMKMMPMMAMMAMIVMKMMMMMMMMLIIVMMMMMIIIKKWKWLKKNNKKW